MLRVLEVGAAPACESGDRGATQRARVVGPVVGIVDLHRVEHDALAQRPVARDHLGDLEHVEDRGEERRARGEELGPLLLDAGQPAPLGRRHAHDPLLEGSEPVGVDAQAVRARRDVAVLARGGQPGEVVDRAARADRHSRLPAPHLLDDGGEPFPDAVLEGGAVGARRRVRLDELGRQAADPECDARRPAEAHRVADRDLDAPAADVDAQRGRGFEHEAGAHGREDEPRLFEAADHLHLHAGLGLDAVDELAAVRGRADRARCLRDDLLHFQPVGEQAQAAHARDRAVGR